MKETKKLKSCKRVESEQFSQHLEEMGEKNMDWSFLCFDFFLQRMNCIWKKCLVIF